MKFLGSLSFIKNPLFLTGLVLKLFLGTFLASYFLKDYFIPFVNYFVESGFSNPYQFFIQELPQAFPYPSLMLFIMALPKVLFGWLDPSPTIGFFDFFIYRLPLLAADLSIFLVLYSWLKTKTKKLLFFYWLSPVLIYISFIHGQLDAIPIAFLFGSLYFLFKEKFLWAALFLGLAFSCKTNTLFVYPFFFLYALSKNTKPKDLLLFATLPVLTFLTFNLPFITDPSFIKMVFQNEQQGKVFQSLFVLNGLSFYLIPASFLVLLTRGVLLKNYNPDIFIMFLGFSFSILLFFIPPMPGWYYWLVPFLAYFYVKEDGRSPLLFLGLQAFYLMYFFSIKDSDFFRVWELLSPGLAAEGGLYQFFETYGINADKFVNLAFTTLQSVLFINCVWIYRRGLESYSKHKITSSPFLIGIGGDSGVGKTTITSSIENIFSPKNTAILRGDDMHKWQRGHEKWKNYTHLDPKANHLHKEINFLKRLKAGRKIYRRHYDHNTGRFTREQKLKPQNINIFEGLHPFYLQTQRNLYDLKIFINPDPILAEHWKISRDIAKRGHSKEKILEQINARKKDSENYIQSQLQYADVVVEPSSLNEIKEIGDASEEIQLVFKMTFPNSLFLEPVLDQLSQVTSLKIDHEYGPADRQTLFVSGKIEPEFLEKMTNSFIPGLKNVGGNSSHWPANEFGVVIFLIIYYIFEEADNEY